MSSNDIVNLKVIEAIAYAVYKTSDDFNPDAWRLDSELRSSYRDSAARIKSTLEAAGVRTTVQRAKLDAFVTDIATRPAELVYTLDEESGGEV